MKVIERDVNKDELYDYLDSIEEGDHIEAYFGRCHVEGTVVCKSGTYFRVDTDNDLMGVLELDIADVVKDLIEVVHIKEHSEKEKVVLRII
ncbi:MAG: hypothetical protein PWP15_1366 [Methanothermococcus sp.]|jgi:hypothetical protein|uniref:DUF2097 family protein n=1 Tax=Methanothermococcus TaxID=155862 RepID=UPI00035F5F0B|nr:MULTISPECIES: DUF2097 family protein [Methanothermococcus]MDK2790857.1 hypothetical protein [Methanothermococcus sp.]MDK2987715.1 hypothetical protein [Methanothermococcus sp.]